MLCQGSIKQLNNCWEPTKQINTCFPNLDDLKEGRIDIFCDASWGNLPDGIPSALDHDIFYWLTTEGFSTNLDFKQD